MKGGLCGQVTLIERFCLQRPLVLEAEIGLRKAVVPDDEKM